MRSSAPMQRSRKQSIDLSQKGAPICARRMSAQTEHFEDRFSTPLSTNGALELPLEEVNTDCLNELLDRLEQGVIRKPEHFNNLHFLLLLLYDAHGYPRDRYPLWRWYHRIKKKFLTAKHLTIDTESARQNILNSLENIIDAKLTISALIEEGVRVEEQYIHSPVHGLFKCYTPLHTYLYMEQIDKPIINENVKIFNIFQSLILRLYDNLHCDLIHFSIAHKKTSLIKHIFGENINWLNASISLSTERGWLPLHYASYVGDKDIVKTICDLLTSSPSTIQFDIISLIIPNFKQKLFDNNPNEYILKVCGIENSTASTKHRISSCGQSSSIDSQQQLLRERVFQQKVRSNNDARDQPSISTNTINNAYTNVASDSDIPDADELELSSLPLVQRDEFIDKLLHTYDTKQTLIPSPLILACLASCGERIDYEEIVKTLIESHLFEFDGLNHECILNSTLDYMYRKDYARFQRVLVYRDTETEGPSAYIYYQFDGFIVNQDIKPIPNTVSGSLGTLNTSKNTESADSDDDNQNATPISVRCLLTVLVLRDIFLQYPRWDFHLLRENIEEHFSDLESALGCRPTILYPDGDVISSRKRSDVTWEVIVKYRLSSETGESLYMQVDYYFFESYGDPLADALANIYQTPFYMSCMTDSTTMMNIIFDSFFKRRHLHRWGTVAQKHLEHCFDGILQIKNNCTTFLCLCATLARYYQLDGDPFMEENSAIIQRIFVHAFACCVRRNAKIELDYLIKNHALIYYDSCRSKPSDIRHNILTYCVVRNLAVIFDQLMTNMKTSMYKTYQNSTNPDWQPHIAWKEIIHVIIDPVSQQSSTNEQYDLTQLACYGDMTTNATSIGSIPVLHASGDEYIRCIKARKNIIFKTKKKLSRAVGDHKKTRSRTRRMNSCDPQKLKEVMNHTNKYANGIHSIESRSNSSDIEDNGGLNENITKVSRNIFKNVSRLRWGNRHERHNSTDLSTKDQRSNKPINSTGLPSKLDELTRPKDTGSLPDVNDVESNDDGKTTVASDLLCSTTSNITHRLKLQRRQTTDGIQYQRYSPRRKALHHLQAMFRPIRGKFKFPLDDVSEQLAMTNKTCKTKIPRSTSSYDNDTRNNNQQASDRRRIYHNQRRSDTVVIL